MKSRIDCLVATAFLLAISGDAFAGGTSLVYTYGGGFNLKIPTDPAATRGWMQDAAVYVPEHLIICDLDVVVSIRHTSAFDLQLFIESPAGDAIRLCVSDPLNGYYEGSDYDGTTFDDEADVPIQDASPPFTGSFQPLDPLAFFDGRDACGTWKLQVYDAYYEDTGCLDSFLLIVTTCAPEEPVEIPAPAAGGLALLGLGLIGSRKRHRRA